MTIRGWQPFRAALAWVMTTDEGFVRMVMKNNRLDSSADCDPIDKPPVLGALLMDQLIDEKCLVATFSEVRSSRRTEILSINPHYLGRFRRFAEGAFGIDKLSSPAGRTYDDYLNIRIIPLIHAAVSDICGHIGSETLDARAVAIDGDVVHPAAPMRPSDITETMLLCWDGKLHQEAGERVGQVRAYKSVSIKWTDLLKWFPKPRPPTEKQKKRAATFKAIKKLGAEN
jgi:hypothetical protein